MVNEVTAVSTHITVGSLDVATCQQMGGSCHRASAGKSWILPWSVQSPSERDETLVGHHALAAAQRSCSPPPPLPAAFPIEKS
jgi:hypothetical protein